MTREEMKDRAALAGAVTGRMVTAALWAVFKFALPCCSCTS